MAGGDLLYIFAFIILPTAVLVSCIWALIMLRNGALLPPRHVVAREVDPADEDADAALTEMNPVEETGEHVIVEPAAAPRTVAAMAQVASDATAVVETDPAVRPHGDVGAVESPAAASQVYQSPAEEPPTVVTATVERTQELAVVPLDAIDAGDEQHPTPAPDEPEPVAGADTLGNLDTPSAVPASVLMVPLDEPARPATETAPAAASEPSAPAEGSPDPPPVTAATARRPTRRVAQLRPHDSEPSRSRPRAGQRREPRRSAGE